MVVATVHHHGLRRRGDRRGECDAERERDNLTIHAYLLKKNSYGRINEWRFR
jgi:hypothetical protein